MMANVEDDVAGSRAPEAALGPPDITADPIVNFPNLVLILSTGVRGVFDGPRIKSVGSSPGHVAYGPYWPLQRGRYVAEFEITGQPAKRYRDDSVAVAEVVDGGTFFGQRSIKGAELGAQRFEVPFEIPRDSAWRPVEFRLWTSGQAELALERLSVRRL